MKPEVWIIATTAVTNST